MSEQDPNKPDIIRHEPSFDSGSESPPAQLTDAEMDAIGAHVEKFVGPIEMVLHEIVSEGIHLDVLKIAPSEDFPFRAFVTMGMSAAPMSVPDDEESPRFAELMICLPPDWPCSQDDFNDPDNYWPVRWLKELARLPISFETFLDMGHTVPNGDPAEPFTENCPFVCWMVLPPALDERGAFIRSSGKNIALFQIVPLFREEMELHLEQGSMALFERFDAANLSPMDLASPSRVNVGA